MPENGKLGETRTDELLKRIRDDYRHCLDYWRENRDEMAEDMKFVGGDHWDPTARREREANGRLCLSPDELGQYLNQANNQLMQNPIAIKLSPAGAEATNKQAELRSATIKGLEYRSNAQSVYQTAYSQAASCGMGFFMLRKTYLGKGYDVEPRLRRIPNQFTVLLDPAAKEADFSDSKKLFVLDKIRIEDFKRKYPKAQKRSFAADEMNEAPDWIKGDELVLAEVWYAESRKRKKLQVDAPEGPVSIYEDELDAKAEPPKVLNERDEEETTIIQYITNGLEILSKIEWEGSNIPIFVVHGKEIYTNTGGESKRIFLSLVRLARTPQKMLAYIASQEAEEFGMAPRAPFVGLKGQFNSDREAWASLNKVPRAFVEVDIPLDLPAGTTLPMPSRPQFTPNAQAYEISREAWRRSIQAAMGIMPMPTSAQRQNEKSGIALQRIQDQEAIGSFHITNSLKLALVAAGRQIDELITKTMDTPRQVGIQTNDGKHKMIHVVPKGQPAPPEVQPDEYLIPDHGEYDVTISTGPSYQSQREEAADFADTLIQNLPKLGLPPDRAVRLFALAIELRELGPLGDKMVQIVEGDPNQSAQQAHQAMAQLQQAQQVMQDMHQELTKLQLEKQGKVIENQAKEQITQLQEQAKVQIEGMRIEFDRWKAELDSYTKITVSENMTKAQKDNVRSQLESEELQKLHSSAHEAGMQASEQQHERSMADMQHQQTLDQAQQGHEQALEQGQQSGDQQAELQAQAADQSSQAEANSANQQ